MKQIITILLTSIIVLHSYETFAQQLRTAEPVVQHRAGEVLFQVQSETDVQKQVLIPVFGESINGVLLGKVAEELNIFKVTFDSHLWDEKDVLTKIRFNKNIKAAQFNHIVQERSTPNDPLFPQQWSLTKIGAPSVWDVTTGGLTACGDTIVVAVLDQGFDINHNDLKANIWHNSSEIPNNNIDDDKNGYIDDYNGWSFGSNSDKHSVAVHGTNCIGVIGAQGNNNNGVTGINWNVKMLILSGITDDDKIISAYMYALNLRKKYTQTGGKQGAYVAVSSMSLGFRGAKPAEFPLLCDIYNTLGEGGILNVVAADNVTNDIEQVGDVPGLCPSEHLIVVTRTDKNGALPSAAGYSNKFVDLAAPGESILTTFPNNATEQVGGNSFAAPLVAGAAALIMSIPQDSLCKMSKSAPLKAMTIFKEAILKGVTPLTSLQGKTVTGGELNVAKTLNYISRLFGAPIGEYSILKIFPNPVDAQLFLSLQLPEKVEADLIIVNSIGQIVIQRKIVDKDLLSNKISINTEGLAQGIYFVSILSTDFISTKKFVVAHR